MISSLLSLLSSLFPLPSALVLRPSDLDRACLSLLAQGLSQTLSVSQVLLFKTRKFYLLSSFISLLPSRFSLRSSLFSLLSPPVSLLSSLSALFPLLSSRSALFPLLLVLVSSQIALRTSHCELCIRPSIPLPIHSTLCLTIPGPAECAKRLNNNDNDDNKKNQS